MRRIRNIALSLAFLLVVAAIVAACTQPGTPTQTAPPSSTPLPVAVATPTPQPPTPGPVAAIPVPPDRDLYDLTRRLRLKGASPAPAVAPPPGGYQVGYTEAFWVVDMEEDRAFQVNATLRAVSRHAYWYVEEGQQVSQEALERAATGFEQEVYPKVTAAFGYEPSPGPNGDPRLTILHTRIGGAGGYFSGADQYPRAVHPYSNQRAMIYVNLEGITVGSRVYLSLLAHELQHALHWTADATEETWVNEGLSELATDLAGFPSSLVREFAHRPTVSLTNWPGEPEESLPHYAAAHLFMRYLFQHYGGQEGVRRLVTEPQDGIAGLDSYLKDTGYSTTFADVFKDWVVANLLGQTCEGRYCYRQGLVKVSPTRFITTPGEVKGGVPPFAAEYVSVALPQGNASVRFQGQATAALFPDKPHSGTFCWWSNRGDAIASTLTREMDLRSVKEASLEFWAWFNIEKGWDYAYVEVSDDGGDTWTVLPATHTSPDNPLGNSFGPGFTGKSGGWVRSQADLTPFADRRVLLRFQYVTDDAVNLDGLCLDDIAAPQIGFLDDAEGDTDWTAEGFVRTDNALPQQFAVQIVEFPAAGEPVVRELMLDSANVGEMRVEGFGTRLRQAVVVVSPITPVTAQRASYTLSVLPAP